MKEFAVDPHGLSLRRRVFQALVDGGVSRYPLHIGNITDLVMAALTARRALAGQPEEGT